mgnify:CR=1 FL=1
MAAFIARRFVWAAIYSITKEGKQFFKSNKPGTVCKYSKYKNSMYGKCKLTLKE